MNRNLFARASLSANAECYVDMAPTLMRHMSKGGVVVATGYVVRRLMPVECERLQGFPDGWTDIKKKIKKKKDGTWEAVPVEETPDTPRYKAMGNSMAVPCMRWLGERIQAVDGR